MKDLAESWNSHDPGFPKDISVKTFYGNAQEHLKDMKEDKKLQ